MRPPAPTERPDWMEPFARTINAAKKYVVSSTLTGSTGTRNSCAVIEPSKWDQSSQRPKEQMPRLGLETIIASDRSASNQP